MKRLAIVPCLLLLTSMLAAQQPLTTDSIRIDGIYRTFHFTKPDAPRKNGSVVFVLHGSGGNGRQMARATSALEQRAATDNFIAVYPDAYKKFWNECRKGSNAEANLRDVDEVAFFNAMIDYFSKAYGTDASRSFAVGTSGGGHMAYKLALLDPSRIRAVTAIIANLPAEENMDCTPLAIPVPIMIVNGTEDPVNPYGGGQVRAGAFNPGPYARRKHRSATGRNSPDTRVTRERKYYPTETQKMGKPSSATHIAKRTNGKWSC